jgi:hypothetical protein
VLTLVILLRPAALLFCPPHLQGLDIGPDSIKEFSDALKECKTVVWNGPMGVFEFDKFAKGTMVSWWSLEGLRMSLSELTLRTWTQAAGSWHGTAAPATATAAGPSSGHTLDWLRHPHSHTVALSLFFSFLTGHC